MSTNETETNNKIDPNFLQKLKETSIKYLAYSYKIKFQKIDYDYLKSARIKFVKKFVKITRIIPLFKIITVCIFRYDFTIDINIMDDTSWTELLKICVNNVKNVVKNPDEITSIAFGPNIEWRPYGKYKYVLDTRDNSKLPSDIFEDGDLVHIVMIQRNDKWHPTAWYLNKCNYCNILESTIHTLKRCAQCDSVHYCNQQCQKADWIKHKTQCNKDKLEI
uniref:MYND-type domain-containing protein n=1 Tax=viral metagenome TaxID=1070528 RepID=A0A6C0CY46_9ZZZZ